MKSAGRLGVAMLAVAAIGAAGCGSSGSAGGSSGGGGGQKAGSPISVLSIGDLTGPTKLYGQQHLAGLRAAADYLNAQGGIEGHQIKIKAVSSNGDATTAVSAAVKELATPGKYQVVDAGSEGSEVAALTPVLPRFGVLALSLNDGNNQCVKVTSSSCTNQFSMNDPNAMPMIQAAQWAKSKGYKKVGILEEAIDFTQTETPYFLSEFKKLGIQTVKVSFPASAVDVSAQMSELKGKGVDLVVAEALGPPAGYTLKARSKLGWDVPVLFDPAASSLDLTLLAPASQTKNAFLLGYTTQDGRHVPPGLTLIKRYAKPAGLADKIPVQVIGNGWDELLVLSHAVKLAHGSLAVGDLKKALEATGTAGIAEPLLVTSQKKGYSPTNHENIAGQPDDYTVLPVGPVKGAQNQPQ
jgi:ABC-type branched-subunit amino acid transport system substrate-binding protein